MWALVKNVSMATLINTLSVLPLAARIYLACCSLLRSRFKCRQATLLKTEPHSFPFVFAVNRNNQSRLGKLTMTYIFARKSGQGFPVMCQTSHRVQRSQLRADLRCSLRKTTDKICCGIALLALLIRTVGQISVGS